MAAFVAGLGTGGTLMGNGRRLKEELGDASRSSPPSRCRASPCRACARSTTASSRRSSTSSLLDRKIFVTNRDAIIWTRKLLDEEGIFAGVSSGAIASIAVRIAGELDEGNVVFVVCDDGWKYLSSGIYTLPGGRDREPGLHRLVVIRPRRRGAVASMTASLERRELLASAGVRAGGILGGVPRRVRGRGRAARAPRGTARALHLRRRRSPSLGGRRARATSPCSTARSTWRTWRSPPMTPVLPRLRGSARALALRLQAQERDHADGLSEAILQLGGTPSKPQPTYSFPRLRGQAAALRFATGIENRAIAAYMKTLPRLTSPDLRGTAAAIVTDEAEHLAVLLGELGRPQLPQAFVTGAN